MANYNDHINTFYKQELNVISYNLFGINNGMLMLNKITASGANLCLMCQETWVTPDQLSYFDSFKIDYYVFGISAMDSTLSQGILRGRPKGGVFTFVSKSLESSLGRIDCISCAEKFVIVLAGRLLLINVYLPSVRSLEELDELRLIFSEIEILIIDLDYSYVVFGGDWNCDVTKNSRVSLFINDWMSKINLTLANNVLQTPSTITYTFSGKSRDAYSYIDHFYVSNIPDNLAHSITDIDDSENFSNHVPIVLKLDRSIFELCKQNISAENRFKKINECDSYKNNLLDWENSSKSDYYNLTRCEFNSLCNLFLNSDLTALKTVRPDIFSQNGINDIYRNIVHVLYNASLKTIKSKIKNSHNKHWWDSSLNKEKRDAKKQFDLWYAAGKPKSGSLYNEKCSTRNKYRNAIFKKRTASKNHIGEKLQKNLFNANSRKFWKCWNGCFKKSNCKQNINVNGLSEDLAIADYLAEEFKRTCTPHDLKKHEEFKCKYLSRKTHINTPSKCVQISVRTVDEAVNKIDSNKAPGFDQITIEHIAFAHPSVIIILTRLFNIMINTGFVPDDFGIGVTTPIPKFKGNKKNVTSDDYRGITICPVISKIFEHCIASNIDYIKTFER